MYSLLYNTIYYIIKSTRCYILNNDQYSNYIMISTLYYIVNQNTVFLWYIDLLYNKECLCSILSDTSIKYDLFLSKWSCHIFLLLFIRVLVYTEYRCNKCTFISHTRLAFTVFAYLPRRTFWFSAQMLSLTGTLHHSKSMYRTLIYYHVRCLFHMEYDLLLSNILHHMYAYLPRRTIWFFCTNAEFDLYSSS
jgi:hypothetical protein